MGRKKNIKKRKKEELDSEEEEEVTESLTSNVRRSAVAIILFTVAILVFLGFLGQAGVVGRFLDRISSLSVGWMKLVFPVFLIIAGIILLFRKRVSFYVTKLVGLGTVFLSFTGIFHWFFGFDKMLVVAKAGKGGGYIGWALSYVLKKYLGNAGSLVVLIAIFFIGIIMAFDNHLFNFFSHLKNKVQKKKISEDKNDEDDEEGDSEEENENKEEEENENDNEEELPKSIKSEVVDDLKKEKKKKEKQNNIGQIEFVEGRDQYISPDLENTNFLPDELVERKSMDLKYANRTQAKTKNSKNKNKKWIFPPLNLLEESFGNAEPGDIESNFAIIEKTLKDFGIKVTQEGTRTGPTVTQYRIRPADGVKISKILALQNDLALALAKTIRIEAPIPGESLVGIEVPNEVPSSVRLRDLLENRIFKKNRKSDLTLALGENIGGKSEYGDLSKMPHLMIAGATGKGKSVCINSLIITLLYQNSPKNLKFIMVDPKRVELSVYNGIPHLLTDVVVENKQVIKVLNWAVGEMERRYKMLQSVGSRDIISYRKKKKEGKTIKYTDPETGETVEEELKDMPYIVIVIDELADLMSSHGKEVEGTIARIAQMARAVGMHLIVSTQRPSVEVITGLIKANITTRIAFRVATQIDSRTIIDMGGAEKLIGNGDMLYLSNDSQKPKRIQGALISESEVNRVVEFINEENKQEKTEDEEDISDDLQKKVLASSEVDFDEEDDELLEVAKKEIKQANKASASFLQRRLRVGYARAARILDTLEERKIIGPANGNKPREVYISDKKEDIGYDDPLADQAKRDKWQM